MPDRPLPVPDATARRRALEKAARAIESEESGARVDQSVAPAAVRALAPERRTELEAAIARVSPERLIWSAPRKSTGAVDAAAALALLPLGEPDRRPGTREPWLVARARRDAPGSFGLSVEELISENESHRWDRTPWRWDSTDPTSPEERWGGTLDAIGADLADLDAGRWSAVLGRVGIATDDRLTALLAGEDAERSLADLTAVWLPRLADWMARAGCLAARRSHGGAPQGKADAPVRSRRSHPGEKARGVPRRLVIGAAAAPRVQREQRARERGALDATPRTRPCPCWPGRAERTVADGRAVRAEPRAAAEA